MRIGCHVLGMDLSAGGSVSLAPQLHDSQAIPPPPYCSMSLTLIGQEADVYGAFRISAAVTVLMVRRAM